MRDLPTEAAEALEGVGHADIVVGIPSFNNARTIRHVVRAAQAGIAKYFPQLRSVIINSDGGSTDGTREAVMNCTLESSQLLFLSTPMFPVHRLSLPYDGVPGKGSAFRLVFQIARHLGAKACAVVDSDLRSITPEWIDLLLRPVLHAGFDFVTPYYHRHKFDGTITNSIVYPLTRSLYGRRVRQPIGGDFGLSQRLLSRYLERDDWEADAARFGIDIWMTTIALAEGFRVCQSFLGAKLHDAKDPGSDLSDMLHQVVGSVFALMGEYERVWKTRAGSEDVELFGFRYGVGLDPIDVNVNRMLKALCLGCRNLGEVWTKILSPEVLTAVTRLGCDSSKDRPFHLDDDLWARIVLEYAIAYKCQPVERSYLLRSLTPLYLARVASFVLETGSLMADEVEDRIEHLCMCFEQQKPYLISCWDSLSGRQPSSPVQATELSERVYPEVMMEEMRHD